MLETRAVLSTSMLVFEYLRCSHSKFITSAELIKKTSLLKFHCYRYKYSIAADTCRRILSIGQTSLKKYKQLKTSMQEQHKSTYAAFAPLSTIRIGSSNCTTYLKMVAIGAKMGELQKANNSTSNFRSLSNFSSLNSTHKNDTSNMCCF